jgi:SPP1 gp7 family putative phage head morphogenesis protein
MAVRPHLRNGTNIIARRANELWYQRRLKVMADDMQQEVSIRLRPYIERLPHTADEVLPTDRAVVLREVAALTHAAREHFRMPFDARRTAENIARMSLRATDEWWARMVRGWVDVPPSSLPQPRIHDAEPVPVRAARRRRGTHPLATLSFVRGQEASDAAFSSLVADNVALIETVPSDYFDRIEEILFEHVQTAERWESLVDKLDEGLAQANNAANYRVELIARDQSSKMAASFNRARSEAVGIYSYTWQTAGDERVRPTHEANDGQVFTFAEGAPIDDGEMGNPGDDINCRCAALPYVELGEEAA